MANKKCVNCWKDIWNRKGQWWCMYCLKCRKIKDDEYGKKKPDPSTFPPYSYYLTDLFDNCKITKESLWSYIWLAKNTISSKIARWSSLTKEQIDLVVDRLDMNIKFLIKIRLRFKKK